MGQRKNVFGLIESWLLDDKTRIVYQLDFEPGLAVNGDMDMVDQNAIVYLEVDTVGLFDNTTSLLLKAISP